MMRVSSTFYLLLSLALLCEVVNGWTTPQQQQHHQATVVSRRDALLKGLVVATTGAASTLFAPTQPTFAAAVATPEEIIKLQTGHARVAYLLQNWDKLTMFCGSKAVSKQVVQTEDGQGGGNACEKTPLVIQEYLGFKSTNDPLFKADKLMLRAVPLANDQDAYLEAVERYREKADMVSLMAYTSSWTGANQGFGVDDALDSTKDDVAATEKILREILGYLDLKILPPSKDK